MESPQKRFKEDEKVKKTLKPGAEKARGMAGETLKDVYQKMGIK